MLYEQACNAAKHHKEINEFAGGLMLDTLFFVFGEPIISKVGSGLSKAGNKLASMGNRSKSACRFLKACKLNKIPTKAVQELQAILKAPPKKQLGAINKLLNECPELVPLLKETSALKHSKEVVDLLKKPKRAGVLSKAIKSVSKKAPEFVKDTLTENEFLRAAEKYLGPGYKELSNGRYLSKDGLRQVRYGLHEITSKIHHAHFETYNKAGGKVIKNARVLIKP